MNVKVFSFVYVIVAAICWLVWSCICFIYVNPIPWFLFLLVFIGYVAIVQGGHAMIQDTNSKGKKSKDKNSK